MVRRPVVPIPLVQVNGPALPVVDLVAGHLGKHLTEDVVEHPATSCPSGGGHLISDFVWGVVGVVPHVITSR